MGMAIMGFGGGALIASPVSTALLAWYDPTSSAVGWVASGDAVGKLFLSLAVIYLAYMMFGAFTIKVPAATWKPAGFDPSVLTRKALVTTHQVSASNAIKSRQFWLVWIVLFCNVTAGIGILEQAAPMIQDFFRQNDGVSLVSAAVASGFVGLLSIANMGGRFVWSAASDLTGRKNIYVVYLGIGTALYVLLALLGSSTTALYVVLGFIIISFYGGGFSAAPAYLRDLFGTFQVGAIHGRLLTAWSAAGIAGPLIVNSFLDAQGTPGKLTAAAYQPGLLTMVGLLVVGFIANLLVRPVDPKFHESDAPRTPAHELVREA